jgi:hypothetical protein
VVYRVGLENQVLAFSWGVTLLQRVRFKVVLIDA